MKFIGGYFMTTTKLTDYIDETLGVICLEHESNPAGLGDNFNFLLAGKTYYFPG